MTAAMSGIDAELQVKLARLRDAAIAEPYPEVAVRRDRIRRAIDQLIRNEQRILDALMADFGNRPEALNLLTDVMSPIRSLKDALRNVQRWMRPEKRRPEFPMGLIGARTYIFDQPLGVVGIVSPWNAPVALAFTPLAGVLAAGNRAMIKPSELVPNVSDLIAEMIASAFDESEVAVALGGVDVARAFTALPFDHLVFTGGAGTARAVMKAAAEHLVPVTLELGGKSPTIIAPGADLAYAANKILTGKFANAGQVCMAPDFALVQREALPGLLAQLRATAQRMYPAFERSPDFTRVHLPRQRERLAAMVEEAQRRGATVEILSGGSVAELARRDPFPPVLVVNAPLDTAVMRDEVFGPVLPVFAYDTLPDALAMLRGLSRPLALYLLGANAADRDYVLKHSHAGGMTFDDVMLHPFMQDLPFGGVGESGMGRYLGHDGFKAFSNRKGVAHRPWFDVTRFIAPPFKPSLSRALRRAIRL